MLRVVFPLQRYVRAKRTFIKRGVFMMEGNGSFYVPKIRGKYMVDRIVREWPDLDGEVLPMTPGEAARTELKRAFPDLKRVGWNRPMVKLFDWRWPMYCKYTGRS